MQWTVITHTCDTIERFKCGDQLLSAQIHSKSSKCNLNEVYYYMDYLSIKLYSSLAVFSALTQLTSLD